MMAATGSGRTKSDGGPARFVAARRLVVKIGSSLVADADGQPQSKRLENLIGDIAALHRLGKAIVLVSSGAVALGRETLGLAAGRPMRLEEKQAAAAAGQVRLMATYRAVAEDRGLAVAQALLTNEDTENRRRWLNARETLETLLEHGCLPVVNENDTVATEEIRYGDNDRLAARVAQMIGAGILVLLSDTDGLYTADPARDPSARHLTEIPVITPEIRAMAGGPNRDRGTGSGGMTTKIEAAAAAMRAGCATAIASGDRPRPVRSLASPQYRASWFLPSLSPRGARRRWLAGTLRPCGTARIDEGAAHALAGGASLLHAGVTAIEGQFNRGDAIAVRDNTGRLLAHGISAYASEDARALIGRHSSDIQRTLGYSGRPALVHRDDLAMADMLRYGSGPEREQPEGSANGS